VLVYLTDHGDNSGFFHDTHNEDFWLPEDVCNALQNLRDLGTPTLLCLAFCGSGFWLRSVRFFAEQQPSSAISVVADDTSNSHEGQSFNIFSNRNPNISLGTQFLHRLLTYFSNYHNGDADIQIDDLADTLGGGGLFGGYYSAGNRAHSIWEYFGSNMNTYSSALVRRPDVQYFNLHKTGANASIYGTFPSILARWSPRLQMLIKHCVGLLPFENEITSLDLLALGKDSHYIKTVLRILLDNAFIIIPEYDGEFSVFVLAAFKISIDKVEKGVAYVVKEFD